MDVDSLHEIARVIAQGGVVAYPTESCYGLGCDPRQTRVVRRLLRLKHRPPGLGLIIIGAHLKQLYPYIDTPPEVLERIARSWPGPCTWVVPATTAVSPWIRGQHDGVAVRLTAHPGAAAVCRYARRAIISTSANRHQRPPARSAGQVRREFGDGVDFVLEGRLGRQEKPTEIRDALTNRILRQGG